MVKPTKPLVLVCSTPVSGHIIPMMAIARYLVGQGYEVCFVSATGFRSQIEATGALFVPVEGYGDFHDIDDLRVRELGPNWPEFLKTLHGIDHFIQDMDYIFCKSLPSQYQALQKTLKLLSEKYPDRPIILLTEGMNFAASPFIFGAPGLRPKAHIAIGLNPIMMSSIDHPPFGPGLPPDSSPEGQERNKAANDTQKQVLVRAQTAFEEALISIGAKKPEIFMLDSLYRLPHRFIQMCAPSAEYPRSDAPETLRFSGGYPKEPRDVNATQLAWWHEVTGNKEKKIIFVCPGTAARDVNQLIVPTMTALKGRSGLLVVVALGRKGATLPEDVVIPANARVTDYIPYDDVLPYCDVFVTTGGYGGFQRALANGTPLVIGGITEDKPEIAARANWLGVGVNLGTNNPSPRQIEEAVDEVLSNGEYRAKASGIQAEMKGYDPTGVILQNIEELAAGNV